MRFDEIARSKPAGVCPSPGAHQLGPVAAEQFVVADPGLACAAAQPSALAKPRPLMPTGQWRWPFNSTLPVPMPACWPCPPRVGGTERCPGMNHALLQSGRVADRDWQLLDWQPHVQWLERCNCIGVMAVRAGWTWSCGHDAHRSFGFCGDPWHQQPGVASGVVAHQSGRRHIGPHRTVGSVA